MSWHDGGRNYGYRASDRYVSPNDPTVRVLSDDELCVAIAARLVSHHGIDATSEMTGGWIYCVLVPAGQFGDIQNGDLTWFFGTANSEWGGSLISDFGENPNNVDTAVPSTSQDVYAIADAIAQALRQTYNR